MNKMLIFTLDFYAKIGITRSFLQLISYNFQDITLIFFYFKEKVNIWNAFFYFFDIPVSYFLIKYKRQNSDTKFNQKLKNLQKIEKSL